MGSIFVRQDTQQSRSKDALLGGNLPVGQRREFMWDLWWVTDAGQFQIVENLGF